MLVEMGSSRRIRRRRKQSRLLFNGALGRKFLTLHFRGPSRLVSRSRVIEVSGEFA